jgi:uncharacterized protein (DUF2147 family)
MKKLFVAAALLMATTAAHAGNSISFEIDGQKIHIVAPKGCDQLSCIQIKAPGLSGSSFGLKNFKSGNDDNDVAQRSDPPAPAPAPAPTITAGLPQPSAPSTPAAVAPTAPAPAARDEIITTTQPPSSSSTTATAPAIPAAAPVQAPIPAAATAAPVQAPTTPVGAWATEENKGNVRIESCGQNLCGYSVPSNEKILINMRPQDSKWTGHIHDPDSGRTYDSTIAMKGANTLRVQGCAFGGMFCGGQTWKRIS